MCGRSREHRRDAGGAAREARGDGTLSRRDRPQGQPDRVVAVGLTLTEARKREADEQAKLAAEPGYRSFAMSRPLALIQLQKEVSDETNT